MKSDKYNIPKPINPRLLHKKDLYRRKNKDLNYYLSGIFENNRVVLSQAITLVESTNSNDALLAEQILEACLQKKRDTFRLGITGVPGVGKSTFINVFGTHLIDQNHKVAVLTIDPSSQLNRGSILGDKTRMDALSVNPNAFIRPSAAGDTLGGVARKTHETMILCEAAGYDFIIIETVGVGQSEIAVNNMVDCFLLLLIPSGGDELQGIKRGIVEMADIFIVNKADGDLKFTADKTAKDYKIAAHLFPPKESGWVAQVSTCSAIKNEGIDKILETIKEYKQKVTENQFFINNRKNKSLYWLLQTIKEKILSSFHKNENVVQNLQNIQSKVISGEITPFKGASMLFELYKQKA